MSNEVILDTALVEGIWIGGLGTQWLAQVVSGDVEAAVTASSYAELVRRAPDRRAEIQLMALIGLVNVLDLTGQTARRAGQIARDLDSADPDAMLGAVVAATALETSLAVACLDDEFYSAMGCRIAEID
jgi:predicted nucleic acid-binding protein